MNLGELISLAHHAAKVDALYGAIPGFVNDTLRDIQQRRSWLCMRATESVTISSGTSSANLNSLFKEPRGGKHSLRGLDSSTGSYIPWELLARQELEDLNVIGLGAAERRAYIDFGSGVQTLNLPENAAEDLTFELQSYRFLADLSDDSDTNYFTTNYPQLVLEGVKARLLAADDDTQRADLAEIRFAQQFTSASRDDAYRQVAGRNIRMGGL